MRTEAIDALLDMRDSLCGREAERALLEFIGYHQVLSLERLIATFQVRRKRGRWGKAERAGIVSS